MDSQIDLFHEFPEGILRKSAARRELSSRHDNSVVVTRYYFVIISSTASSLYRQFTSVYVRYRCGGATYQQVRDRRVV